jgi:hypothetical protein
MTIELTEYHKPLAEYRKSPHLPNNPYEAALTIHCDKLGSNLVLQHKITDNAAKCISSGADETHIIGVGNFGIDLTGKYNPLTNDGRPSSHGVSRNDADFFIASNNPDWKKRLEGGIRSGIAEIMKDPGIDWWHRFGARWSAPPSSWDVPPYMKVRFFELGGETRNHWHTNRENKGRETLHIHHTSTLEKDWWELFLADYQPWKSNIIGSPMYYRRLSPVDTGNTLLNPFETEIEPAVHLVGLTTQKHFARKPKSVLQATRVALGVIQAGFAAKVPAEIDPVALEVMRDAVNIHAPKLTHEQREQALLRLGTVFFRARGLQNHYGPLLASHYTKDFFKERGLPDAELQIARILDNVSWGKAVLGQTVESYLGK